MLGLLKKNKQFFYKTKENLKIKIIRNQKKTILY
jgi:hypothetical protein